MPTTMKVFDMGTEAGCAAVAQIEQKHAILANTGQQLYAKIKRSSKYFGQTDKNELFAVHILPCRGDYVVQGGPGGQYRLADVNLFLVGDDGFALRIA